MGIDPATWAIITGIATAATSIGSTVYSAATQPKKPEPPLLGKPEDPMKAAYAEMEAIRKRKGAASTILTGPEGVMGQPSTLKAQLG